jgi:hypothetical protein
MSIADSSHSTADNEDPLTPRSFLAGAFAAGVLIGIKIVVHWRISKFPLFSSPVLVV